MSLIQKFTVHQAGNLQGIDAYNYMINNEGVGAVIELILPWDKTLLDHINVRIEANQHSVSQILTPLTFAQLD